MCINNHHSSNPEFYICHWPCKLHCFWWPYPVVGKWLLYLSKVTLALSVVFFCIFRRKCSFSSPISHVRTWTIVHNMNLSHMKKRFKSNDENWCYLLKIHTRNLKRSFHSTGTKIKKGRAGGKMATDGLWTLYIKLLFISRNFKEASAAYTVHYWHQC